jgi:hypothetical protein
MKLEPCEACEAEGDCPECSGDGVGATGGLCPECDGDGECEVCNGTGFVDEEGDR